MHPVRSRTAEAVSAGCSFSSRSAAPAGRFVLIQTLRGCLHGHRRRNSSSARGGARRKSDSCYGRDNHRASRSRLGSLRRGCAGRSVLTRCGHRSNRNGVPQEGALYNVSLRRIDLERGPGARRSLDRLVGHYEVRTAGFQAGGEPGLSGCLCLQSAYCRFSSVVPRSCRYKDVGPTGTTRAVSVGEAHRRLA